MIQKYRHIIFISAIVFITCGFIYESKGVDPKSYIEAYQSKNSILHKQLISGPIEYTVSFMTKEIQVIQAFKRGTITNEEAQVWLNKKDNEISLLFQIEIPTNGNQEFLKFETDSSTYDERVKYFSFGFKNDLALLVDGKDTIKITDYHFERNFGISPKGTITMSTVLPKKSKKLEIIFNDRIYGKGHKSIEFDLKEISSLPKLKTINKWKNQK